MYLYAIKELNTDLFVSYSGINYSLKPLGIFTNFYKTREAAARAITMDIDGIIHNPIASDLAWEILENKYKKDRWFIPLSKEEFNEIKDRFDLKVIKLYIGELDEGDIHAESEEEDD